MVISDGIVMVKATDGKEDVPDNSDMDTIPSLILSQVENFVLDISILLNICSPMLAAAGGKLCAVEDVTQQKQAVGELGDGLPEHYPYLWDLVYNQSRNLKRGDTVM